MIGINPAGCRLETPVSDTISSLPGHGSAAPHRRGGGAGESVTSPLRTVEQPVPPCGPFAVELFVATAATPAEVRRIVPTGAVRLSIGMG
jgi:hypothetical protein